MYSVGTWFVWGIYVEIPCIKETMMMMIIIIQYNSIPRLQLAGLRAQGQL
jgi:hypothetical protein